MGVKQKAAISDRSSKQALNILQSALFHGSNMIITIFQLEYRVMMVEARMRETIQRTMNKILVDEQMINKGAYEFTLISL